MKIIDAHMHFSNIQSFHKVSEQSKVDYSLAGFQSEYNGMIAIGMGLTETSDVFPSSDTPNPMKLDLDKNPENMYVCLGYNPKVDLDIENFEQHITKNTVGLKVYAGYYHYHVHHEVYHPLYKVAEKYNLPVVIHSGDTFSKKGLLKYAHPLEIDELAHLFPNVTFIIAHFGDPWIMDAAEVASKNENVYVDLSGLIIGDETDVERFKVDEFITHIKRGLVYLDNYDKVLFGTDWPLVAVKPYIEFIKDLVPTIYHEQVFYLNAKRVFKIKD